MRFIAYCAVPSKPKWWSSRKSSFVTRPSTPLPSTLIKKRETMRVANKTLQRKGYSGSSADGAACFAPSGNLLWTFFKFKSLSAHSRFCRTSLSSSTEISTTNLWLPSSTWAVNMPEMVQKASTSDARVRWSGMTSLPLKHEIQNSFTTPDFIKEHSVPSYTDRYSYLVRSDLRRSFFLTLVPKFDYDKQPRRYSLDKT